MNLKELFNDALPVINKFAPTIGEIIGGPIGMATGYIVPILANAFETSPTNLKKLAETIISDPDSQKKLEMVESNHADWLTALTTTVTHLSSAEVNVKLEWNNPEK